MTSVPTAIDSGKQYFMMSPELEGFINLGDDAGAARSAWSAMIVSQDWNRELPIIFIESHEVGYTLCVKVECEIGGFTTLLLRQAHFTTSIMGESFKSKVLKLESDRCYLELLR